MHSIGEIVEGSIIVRKENEARAWRAGDSMKAIEKLAADSALTVRFEVAINPGTPRQILDRLAEDSHPMVRWAAARREHCPPDRDRIPMEVGLSILHLHPIRSKVEIIYRFARLGLFDFTPDGRVWQAGSLHVNNGGQTFRLTIRPRELFHVVRQKGRPYLEVRIWWLHMAIACPAHRVIYRVFKGFPPVGYHVHHVDGNSLNNAPGNLALMSLEQHRRMHMATPGISKLMDERQLDELREMVEQGVPKSVIMYRMGLHFKTLTDTIRRAGWCRKPWPVGKPWPYREKPRHQITLPFDRDLAARVRSMLEIGMPKTLIARKAGITIFKLLKIIRETGWPVKPWPTARHWPLDEHGMARPEDGRVGKKKARKKK